MWGYREVFGLSNKSQARFPFISFCLTCFNKGGYYTALALESKNTFAGCIYPKHQGARQRHFQPNGRTRRIMKMMGERSKR